MFSMIGGLTFLVFLLIILALLIVVIIDLLLRYKIKTTQTNHQHDNHETIDPDENGIPIQLSILKHFIIEASPLSSKILHRAQRDFLYSRDRPNRGRFSRPRETWLRRFGNRFSGSIENLLRRIETPQSQSVDEIDLDRELLTGKDINLLTKLQQIGFMISPSVIAAMENQSLETHIKNPLLLSSLQRLTEFIVREYVIKYYSFIKVDPDPVIGHHMRRSLEHLFVNATTSLSSLNITPLIMNDLITDILTPVLSLIDEQIAVWKEKNPYRIGSGKKRGEVSLSDQYLELFLQIQDRSNTAVWSRLHPAVADKFGDLVLTDKASVLNLLQQSSPFSNHDPSQDYIFKWVVAILSRTMREEDYQHPIMRTAVLDLTSELALSPLLGLLEPVSVRQLVSPYIKTLQTIDVPLQSESSLDESFTMDKTKDKEKDRDTKDLTKPVPDEIMPSPQSFEAKLNAMDQQFKDRIPRSSNITEATLRFLTNYKELRNARQQWKQHNETERKELKTVRSALIDLVKIHFRRLVDSKKVKQSQRRKALYGALIEEKKQKAALSHNEILRLNLQNDIKMRDAEAERLKRVIEQVQYAANDELSRMGRKYDDLMDECGQLKSLLHEINFGSASAQGDDHHQDTQSVKSYASNRLGVVGEETAVGMGIVTDLHLAANPADEMQQQQQTRLIGSDFAQSENPNQNQNQNQNPHFENHSETHSQDQRRHSNHSNHSGTGTGTGTGPGVSTGAGGLHLHLNVPPPSLSKSQSTQSLALSSKSQRPALNQNQDHGHEHEHEHEHIHELDQNGGESSPAKPESTKLSSSQSNSIPSVVPLNDLPQDSSRNTTSSLIHPTTPNTPNTANTPNTQQYPKKPTTTTASLTLGQTPPNNNNYTPIAGSIAASEEDFILAADTIQISPINPTLLTTSSSNTIGIATRPRAGQAQQPSSRALGTTPLQYHSTLPSQSIQQDVGFYRNNSLTPSHSNDHPFLNRNNSQLLHQQQQQQQQQQEVQAPPELTQIKYSLKDIDHLRESNPEDYVLTPSLIQFNAHNHSILSKQHIYPRLMSPNDWQLIVNILASSIDFAVVHVHGAVPLFDSHSKAFSGFDICITVGKFRWAIRRRFSNLLVLHAALKSEFGKEYDLTIHNRRIMNFFDGAKAAQERCHDTEVYLNDLLKRTNLLASPTARWYLQPILHWDVAPRYDFRFDLSGVKCISGVQRTVGNESMMMSQSMNVHNGQNGSFHQFSQNQQPQNSQNGQNSSQGGGGSGGLFPGSFDHRNSPITAPVTLPRPQLSALDRLNGLGDADFDSDMFMEDDNHDNNTTIFAKTESRRNSAQLQYPPNTPSQSSQLGQHGQLHLQNQFSHHNNPTPMPSTTTSSTTPSTPTPTSQSLLQAHSLPKTLDNGDTLHPPTLQSRNSNSNYSTDSPHTHAQTHSHTYTHPHQTASPLALTNEFSNSPSQLGPSHVFQTGDHLSPQPSPAQSLGLLANYSLNNGSNLSHSQIFTQQQQHQFQLLEGQTYQTNNSFMNPIQEDQPGSLTENTNNGIGAAIQAANNLNSFMTKKQHSFYQSQTFLPPTQMSPFDPRQRSSSIVVTPSDIQSLAKGDNNLDLGDAMFRDMFHDDDDLFSQQRQHNSLHTSLANVAPSSQAPAKISLNSNPTLSATSVKTLNKARVQQLAALGIVQFDRFLLVGDGVSEPKTVFIQLNPDDLDNAINEDLARNPKTILHADINALLESVDDSTTAGVGIGNTPKKKARKNKRAVPVISLGGGLEDSGDVDHDRDRDREREHIDPEQFIRTNSQSSSIIARNMAKVYPFFSSTARFVPLDGLVDVHITDQIRLLMLYYNLSTTMHKRIQHSVNDAVDSILDRDNDLHHRQAVINARNGQDIDKLQHFIETGHVLPEKELKTLPSTALTDADPTKPPSLNDPETLEALGGAETVDKHGLHGGLHGNTVSGNGNNTSTNAPTFPTGQESYANIANYFTNTIPNLFQWPHSSTIQDMFSQFVHKITPPKEDINTSKLLMQFVDKLFDLNENSFMRRRLVWFIKVMLSFSGVSSIDSTIEGLFSAESFAGHIDFTTQILCGYRSPPSPDIAPLQFLQLFTTFFSHYVGSAFGVQSAEVAALKLTLILQSPILLNHIIYSMLDKMLIQMYPDITDEVAHLHSSVVTDKVIAMGGYRPSQREEKLFNPSVHTSAARDLSAQISPQMVHSLRHRDLSMAKSDLDSGDHGGSYHDDEIKATLDDFLQMAEDGIGLFSSPSQSTPPTTTTTSPTPSDSQQQSTNTTFNSTSESTPAQGTLTPAHSSSGHISNLLTNSDHEQDYASNSRSNSNTNSKKQQQQQQQQQQQLQDETSVFREFTNMVLEPLGYQYQKPKSD